MPRSVSIVPTGEVADVCRVISTPDQQPHVDNRTDYHMNNSRSSQMHSTSVTTTTRPTAGVQAKSTRRIALIVGVLFILTFITSIVGVFAYGPVLTDPNYVT